MAEMLAVVRVAVRVAVPVAVQVAVPVVVRAAAMADSVTGLQNLTYHLQFVIFLSCCQNYSYCLQHSRLLMRSVLLRLTGLQKCSVLL